FLRHLESKGADLREALEIFRWNFTGAIDLIRIDMIAQVSLQLAQEIFASRAIFCALRRVRINPIEIVAPNEKIARKTAAVIQWIARGFGQLQGFTLAFGHLRRVDDGGCRLVWLRAGFLGGLFFRRFEL